MAQEPTAPPAGQMKPEPPPAPRRGEMSDEDYRELKAELTADHAAACRGARTPRRAPWFLRSDELQPILDDPAKVVCRLLAALPADARAAIIAFAEFGLTGSVAINFNEGRAGTCESRTHHRLGSA